MSDIIRLLPDSVANQIAAGEVIQRPASVVKELVENAIDAGAKSVEVIIRDAGRTLIQVVDNGKGMSDTDARMAFERHATSKITQADDLFALQTMGFRGEALASICAVAQVELRTRTADSELGTRIVISGSKVESQEPVACGAGSNMMVKNLFFNIPARRKFLKKDAVEFSNIVREFERMALVNPQADLKLIHNDSVIHQLLRGSLKQRISDLFGKSVEKQMIPVSTATSIVKVEGFVGLPEHARRRNALQFLMVNGRHMRHPYFHKAVIHCYEALISSDQQPNYFLNFSVDPSTIDVNIHPTKSEIKFENESAIWQILTAAVREALGRYNAMPGIDFESEAGAIDIPVFNPNENGSHGVEIDLNYNPFAAQSKLSMPMTSSVKSGGFSSSVSLPRRSSISSNWEQLYDGFMSDSESVASNNIEISECGTPSSIPSLIDEQDNSVVDQAVSSTIQVRNRYIMVPSVSGLMVIDQHRAHVKVLFERYRLSLSSGKVAMQQVLFPEVLTITAAQNAVLQMIEQQVCEMGFSISYLGDSSWSVVAVPSILGDANPSEILMRVIDDASSEITSDTDALIEMVALSMARSSAITAGRKLSAEEREQLINELLILPQPNYTPDGLAVIKMISEDELDSLF